MERYRVPQWCTRICLAAESTACKTECAPTRTGKFFHLLDIPIEDMPEFPIRDWVENTSAKERQIIAGAYLTKLVEQAQGREAAKYGNDDLAEFIAYDIDSWVQAITGGE